MTAASYQRVLGAKLGSRDQTQELGLGAGSVEQRDLADGEGLCSRHERRRVGPGRRADHRRR